MRAVALSSVLCAAQDVTSQGITANHMAECLLQGVCDSALQDLL